MKLKGSYDYYLILATVLVLFVISAICIYAMFYFKWAQVQEMAPAVKAGYMAGMNRSVAPFVTALILLLGICVPKRLMPVGWLNLFTVLLLTTTTVVSLLTGVTSGLLVVLFAALALQVVVLALALAGSARLHFERSGYWLRVGSSLMHLGIILFILDLFFYQRQNLHLILFWITTLATVLGMLCCFYSEGVARLARRWRGNAL